MGHLRPWRRVAWFWFRLPPSSPRFNLDLTLLFYIQLKRNRTKLKGAANYIVKLGTSVISKMQFFGHYFDKPGFHVTASRELLRYHIPAVFMHRKCDFCTEIVIWKFSPWRRPAALVHKGNKLRLHIWHQKFCPFIGTPWEPVGARLKSDIPPEMQKSPFFDPSTNNSHIFFEAGTFKHEASYHGDAKITNSCHSCLGDALPLRSAGPRVTLKGGLTITELANPIGAICRMRNKNQTPWNSQCRLT